MTKIQILGVETMIQAWEMKEVVLVDLLVDLQVDLMVDLPVDPQGGLQGYL